MASKRDLQKNARHQAIEDLVRRSVVRTQMELLEHLQRSGFTVTQATVSRDIRELQIGKAVDENGQAKYVITKRPDALGRFESLFADSVYEVASAGNILMVKCSTGMANAVCELFDQENEGHDEVVGTLSGDNTFIVLMRGDEHASRLKDRLAAMIATGKE